MVKYVNYVKLFGSQRNANETTIGYLFFFFNQTGRDLKIDNGTGKD